MRAKNQNRRLFYCFILVAALCSCKKYLTMDDPDSLMSEKYVFSDVSGATNAVMSVYKMLASVYNGGSAPTRYSLDCDEGWGTVGNGDNGQADISRYNITPTNSQLNLVFEYLYNGIDRANNCIKNIPKMNLYNNGSVAQKQQLQRLYGEALTLRAQFFFELIKNWGDVPAPFIPSIDQSDLALPKTDRDTIYNKILADLKTAEDLVPWKGEGAAATIDERITKGAVKGVRARMALYAGGYSLRRSGKMERRPDYLDLYKITRDECNDIIQRPDKHQLNPNFTAVFKNNILAYKIEPNGEVLFETGVGRDALEGATGYLDGPRFIPVGLTALSGSGIFHIPPSFYYAYNQYDIRKDVTFAPYQSDLNTMIRTPKPMSTWSLGKFRLDWLSPLPNSTAQFWGVNLPLLRFSDVLLMFAETENELNNGPTQPAIAAYELVRKRAFKGNESQMGTTPTGKDPFFQAVADERWFELAGEGVRKYDLIRWNMLAKRIKETKDILNKMLAKTPPYDNLPQTMWYKNNSPGDVVWGNSLYAKTPATPIPAGYTAVAWMSGLTAAYITNIAVGFKENHSEMYPIPQTTMDSNPNLKQDFGY